MIVLAARKRIKDRGIKWEETYKEKSKAAKKHFEKVLPGAYFRWEGMDHTTGHPYYVVVGPAISERYGKSFFAGIKKMPIDPKKKAYSPTGKYFSSLRSALHHATDMWGVRMPLKSGSYTENDLKQIKVPRHMKSMEKPMENPF